MPPHATEACVNLDSEQDTISGVIIGWCRVAASSGIDIHQTYMSDSPVVALLQKDEHCALLRIGLHNRPWSRKDKGRHCWSPGMWSDCNGLSILPQGGQLAVLCSKGWVSG